MNKEEQLDTEVFNPDDFAGKDIKITPDYYIHAALVNCQKALTKDNMQEGFIQFRLLVEHAEVIASAAELLDEKYKEDIENYKRSEEYTKEVDSLVKSVKLANKKLEYMLSSVFQNKLSTQPLKM